MLFILKDIEIYSMNEFIMYCIYFSNIFLYFYYQNRFNKLEDIIKKYFILIKYIF